MESKYKVHVFICTNKKQNKECCADKGGEKLRDDLKAWAKQKYGRSIRINASGCLDECSNGVAAVIYPQSDWVLKLNGENIEEFKSKIDQLLTT